MEVTITIHAWWLLAYLLAGCVLYLPIFALSYRKIAFVPADSRGFWHWWRRTRWYVHITTIVLWPLALWEAR